MASNFSPAAQALQRRRTELSEQRYRNRSTNGAAAKPGRPPLGEMQRDAWNGLNKQVTPTNIMRKDPPVAPFRDDNDENAGTSQQDDQTDWEAQQAAWEFWEARVAAQESEESLATRIATRGACELVFALLVVGVATAYVFYPAPECVTSDASTAVSPTNNSSAVALLRPALLRDWATWTAL